ncbi:ras GEF [Ceratobasidium sp. AG-I]|nr:ras GEF [Ceratobasidium sp. AG-I]
MAGRGEYVLAMHDFEPANGNSTCLAFRAGQVIHVLNRDDTGWWDGELEGRRGWFPSNYVKAGRRRKVRAAPVRAAADGAQRTTSSDSGSGSDAESCPRVMVSLYHALLVLNRSVHAARVSHYQPSTACVISSVRTVLTATDCLHKTAPALARFPHLARARSDVLQELGRLVAISKKASADVPDDERAWLAEDMLRHGDAVFACCKRYVEVAVSCGVHVADRRPQPPPEPEPPRSASASSTSSFSSNSPSSSAPRFPTGHVPSAPLLSALRTTHDHLLSIIAAFIGHVHSHSRASHASSKGHLIEMTRETVDKVRQVLTIVGAVCDHPALVGPERVILSAAKDALYASTTVLVDAVKRMLAPAPPGTVREEDEKAGAVQAATGTLRAGGDCVTAVRSCLTRRAGEGNASGALVFEVPDAPPSVSDHARTVSSASASGSEAEAYGSYRRGGARSAGGMERASVYSRTGGTDEGWGRRAGAEEWKRMSRSDASTSADEGTPQRSVQGSVRSRQEFAQSGPEPQLAPEVTAEPGEREQEQEPVVLVSGASSVVTSYGAQSLFERARESVDTGPTSIGEARPVELGVEREGEGEWGAKEGHDHHIGGSYNAHVEASYDGRAGEAGQYDPAEDSDDDDVDTESLMVEPPTMVIRLPEEDEEGQDGDEDGAELVDPQKTPMPVHAFPLEVDLREKERPGSGETEQLFSTEQFRESSSERLPSYSSERLPSSSSTQLNATDKSLPAVPPPIPISPGVDWLAAQTIDPRDVVHNNEGVLIGATLEVLVEKMTAPDHSPDPKFAATFYLAFRLFTTPLELVHTLHRRWDMRPPPGATFTEAEHERWVQTKLDPVRLRVYNCIKTWLDAHWQPAADGVVLGALKEFVSATAASMNARVVQRVVDLLTQREPSSTKDSGAGGLVIGTSRPMVRVRSAERIRIKGQPNVSAPTPVLSKSLFALLKSSSFGSINIVDFDALELARQFTIMESKLYCQILPEEVLDVGGGAGGVRGESVRAMSTLSTAITGWVTEVILDEHDTKKRTGLLKFFIKIADQCDLLNNFSTLRSILAALDSSTISRLSKTWMGLSAKNKARVENLRKLTDHTRNHYEYRARLRGVHGPGVPFLGLYLTDVTFCREGNPDKRVSPYDSSRTLLNFDKYRRLAAIAEDVKRFQLHYNLMEVPEVQKYLEFSFEKAKKNGNDLHDLYRRSLLVEPRQPADNMEHKTGTMKSSELFGWASRDKS